MQAVWYSCVMVCAGAVIGAATFIPWLWPLAPLSIALLLFFIFQPSRIRASWMGFFFGAGLMGAVFSWGFTALPLNWLGVTDPLMSVLLVSCVWVLYSAVLAIPLGILAFGLHFFGARKGLLVVAPVAWVIAEVVRAVLHAISAWGDGSTLSADLTFGFAGYALSWSDFLWLARFGGIYALSLFVVFCGTVLFLLMRSTERSSKKIVLFGVCAGVFTLLGSVFPAPVVYQEEPGVVEMRGVRILPLTLQLEPVLVRTNDELGMKARFIADALVRAMEHDPDIVILPEFSRFLKSESLLTQEESERVREALREHNVLLIDSERDAGDQYGAISFFSGGQGSVLAQQHKRLLIPLGEFLPYAVKGVFSMFGLGYEAEQVVRYRTYAPSRAPFEERLFEWKGLTMSVLACSEVFAPFGYKAASDAGADVLINIASHSWVRGSAPILFYETLAMARVHVVYAGKPYIQASNYAPSYVVYPAF